MTTVNFHFVGSDGTPIANTTIQILLPKAGYSQKGGGVVMPSKLTATTDSEGKASLELEAVRQYPYTLIFSDWKSGTHIRQEFFVPEASGPVAFTDLSQFGPVEKPSYSQSVIEEITQLSAENGITRDAVAGFQALYDQAIQYIDSQKASVDVLVGSSNAAAAQQAETDARQHLEDTQTLSSDLALTAEEVGQKLADATTKVEQVETIQAALNTLKAEMDGIAAATANQSTETEAQVQRYSNLYEAVVQASQTLEDMHDATQVRLDSASNAQIESVSIAAEASISAIKARESEQTAKMSADSVSDVLWSAQRAEAIAKWEANKASRSADEAQLSARSITGAEESASASAGSAHVAKTAAQGSATTANAAAVAAGAYRDEADTHKELARKWATSTDVVASGTYGARKYAYDAAGDAYTASTKATAASLSADAAEAARQDADTLSREVAAHRDDVAAKVSEAQTANQAAISLLGDADQISETIQTTMTYMLSTSAMEQGVRLSIADFRLNGEEAQ